MNTVTVGDPLVNAILLPLVVEISRRWERRDAERLHRLWCGDGWDVPQRRDGPLPFPRRGTDEHRVTESRGPAVDGVLAIPPHRRAEGRRDLKSSQPSLPECPVLLPESFSSVASRGESASGEGMVCPERDSGPGMHQERQSHGGRS